MACQLFDADLVQEKVFTTTGILGIYYRATLPGNICAQPTTTFVGDVDL
jgi:hypothetical protein